MKSLIITLFLICNFINGQDKTFTIEESLKLGLENSKEIKISQANISISLAGVSEITSQMLPRFSFRAVYTRLSDIPPFQVNIPFLGQTIKIQDPILNNYGFQLSVQQPLFTGFRLLSLRNAAVNTNLAAETEQFSIKNKVAAKIYKLFWNFYKAKQLEKLTQKNLDRIKSHFSVTEEFVKNGLATQNDLLKLKVHYANAQLNLIDAENKVNLARAAFNLTIGLNITTDSDVESYDIFLESSTEGLESLKNEAFKNRDDLNSLEHQINASKEGIIAVESNWFPQIFFFGNFYYNNPNQRVMPLEDKFYDTWDLGISLNWTFWDWGYTSSQVEKAEQKYLILSTKEALLKDEIQVEVYNNFYELESSSKKLEVSIANLEHAKENYRITLDKYNNQIASSTDLIDAETELLNAEINIITSQIDFELAGISLKQSLGRKLY